MFSNFHLYHHFIIFLRCYAIHIYLTTWRMPLNTSKLKKHHCITLWILMWKTDDIMKIKFHYMALGIMPLEMIAFHFKVKSFFHLKVRNFALRLPLRFRCFHPHSIVFIMIYYTRLLLFRLVSQPFFCKSRYTSIFVLKRNSVVEEINFFDAVLAWIYKLFLNMLIFRKQACDLVFFFN